MAAQVPSNILGTLTLLWVFFFLAASGLSCGTWAPECVGSLVVARGLQSVWAQ